MFDGGSGHHKCIISTKFGSNFTFTYFFRIWRLFVYILNLKIDVVLKAKKKKNPVKCQLPPNFREIVVILFKYYG
jgi:hypothetical protein